MWWMVCMLNRAMGVSCMSGDTGSSPEYEVKTVMTPDHTAV